jgi:hypothetical protein
MTAGMTLNITKYINTPQANWNVNLVYFQLPWPYLTSLLSI